MKERCDTFSLIYIKHGQMKCTSIPEAKEAPDDRCRQALAMKGRKSPYYDRNNFPDRAVA